jgi:periplasmic protein TonB
MKIMTRAIIFTSEWCDLIFIDKNKNYGAYVLRKLSSRRQAISLLIAIAIFVLGVSLPSIIHSIAPASVEKEVSVRSLSNIKIEKPLQDVDEIVKSVPLTPQFRNMIKFNGYVIKPDDLVPEDAEPRLQQEIVSSTAVIGNIDFRGGTDDPNALIPTEKPNEDRNITEDVMQPFILVEQMPEFPGGEAEMYRYLMMNIKYPPVARDAGISGTVYLKFVVNKDGSISGITILRGIGGGCDEEAFRVVKSMPAWKPGKQNGIAVPVFFTLPVKFTLL